MKKRQHFVHRIPISSPAFSDSSMIFTEGKRDHPFKHRRYFCACLKTSWNYGDKYAKY